MNKVIEERRRWLKYADCGLKDQLFQKIIESVTDEQIIIFDALQKSMYEEMERAFVEKVKKMGKYI